MLEIGVNSGGSLQMWRRYFGEEAVIYGIDINPACARLDGQAGQVRIGSQTDAEFLRSVVTEMGGVDIVLDDGSHQMAHVFESLKILFPLVQIGGIYMIEDLMTSYWRNYGGGMQNQANFFNRIHELIDDMHAVYHGGGMKHGEVGIDCAGIHVHDGMVVLEKQRTHRPVHSVIGSIDINQK